MSRDAPPGAALSPGTTGGIAGLLRRKRIPVPAVGDIAAIFFLTGGSGPFFAVRWNPGSSPVGDFAEGTGPGERRQGP